MVYKSVDHGKIWLICFKQKKGKFTSEQDENSARSRERVRQLVRSQLFHMKPSNMWEILPQTYQLTFHNLNLEKWRQFLKFSEIYLTLRYRLCYFHAVDQSAHENSLSQLYNLF